MQGRFFRFLLISLMGFSCSLFEAEELPPQWVEASLYGAPPLRDILSECESALQASNFPLPFHRDDLQRNLNDNGISSGIHYPTALPYLQAYDYLGYCSKDFPLAFDFSTKILSLPMFAELNGEKIMFITDNIN